MRRHWWVLALAALIAAVLWLVPRRTVDERTELRSDGGDAAR